MEIVVIILPVTAILAVTGKHLNNNKQLATTTNNPFLLQFQTDCYNCNGDFCFEYEDNGTFSLRSTSSNGFRLMLVALVLNYIDVWLAQLYKLFDDADELSTCLVLGCSFSSLNEFGCNFKFICDFELQLQAYRCRQNKFMNAFHWTTGACHVPCSLNCLSIKPVY